MFLRFVIANKDPDSARRQGLFQTMATLRDSGALTIDEEASYKQIYEWFTKNLKKPTSFTRSSKPHAKKVALSWFKTGATEHVSRMREVVAILYAHGVDVTELKTSRPGYVVYEDQDQVAAEPFAETVV